MASPGRQERAGRLWPAVWSTCWATLQCSSGRVRLVVTEGNYLLLEPAPWSAIRGLLDEVRFLAPDEQTRRAWLTTRHRRYGRTPKQAAGRTSGSDERNARLIAPTASRADLILDPTRLI